MLCKLLIKCLPAYHSNRCPDYSLRSTQQLGWSTPHASTSMALPILRDLHWLRIAERIDFKLSVLCFRCLHSMAPPYLADDLHRVAHIEARRRLRSASTAMLVVPKNTFVNHWRPHISCGGSANLEQSATTRRLLVIFANL